MDVICGICQLLITERCVTCSGGCSSHFHMGCVGLNANALKTLDTFPQITWRCVDCSKVTMQTLVKKIDALVDTIAVLSSNLPKKKTWDLNTPKPGGSGRSTRSTARGGDETPKNGNNNHKNDRIPEQGSRSLMGTGSGVSGLSAAGPRKWLYATYFSTTTTTDAIIGLVSSKTGCEDVKCNLLMPKSVANVTDLDYVSFKIGVKPEIYDQLYCPTLWPTGVMLREFVDRPRRFRGRQ
jgi:hypothetical protein